MAQDYLHNHKDFPALLSIIEKDTGILSGLVEKDYWIMHVLYGLTAQDFSFQLKGGTSLSKGYGIINRFSEDLDIQINPPAQLAVNTNIKSTNSKAVQSRKVYYDWLSKNINIDGIISIERDTAFDDPQGQGRSAGIRLYYKSYNSEVGGLKPGILLEVGFDSVTPNSERNITSWAYDKAVDAKVDVIDNTAINIACYHPGYTFVEKLQTIATKYRLEQEKGVPYANLMRQYYDVYSLLNDETVKAFIGSEEYIQHKKARFTGKEKDLDICTSEAFLLNTATIREQFRKRYQGTASLYYKGQPPFDELLEVIKANLDRL